MLTAVFRFNCKEVDFSNTEFPSGVSFETKIFNAGANFHRAVFIGSANFNETKFYGRNVDFSDAVFLAGASFENAKFGKDYQRTFGEWEIRFSKRGDSYFLNSKKINEEEKKWHESKIQPNLSISEFFKKQGIENDANESTSAFNTFRDNPENVSFAGCRFGAININGPFPRQVTNIPTLYTTYFQAA